MIPDDTSPRPPPIDRFLVVIASIVALCGISAAAVVSVVLFHRDATPGENMQIIHVMLGGVLGPAVTALLALALYQVKGAVTEVHVATNSRLSQLLDATERAAHSAGILEADARHTARASEGTGV